MGKKENISESSAKDLEIKVRNRLQSSDLPQRQMSTKRDQPYLNQNLGSIEMTETRELISFRTLKVS